MKHTSCLLIEENVCCGRPSRHARAIRALTQIFAPIAWVVVAATTMADPQYQIYDLGVLETGPEAGSQGLGVSPGGIVVGRSTVSNTSQAFTWTEGGGLIGLPSLVGRNYFVAYGANDSGIVVGASSESGFVSNNLPVIWHDGVGSQLPVPPGYTYARAVDVNASGVAVGSVDYGTAVRGVIYSGGSAAIIAPTAPNGKYFASAYAINDSGRVVGWGAGPSYQVLPSALVYEISTNTTIDIGTLQGGDSAVATDVNNSGVVVGDAFQYNGTHYPFIWSDATGMVALPLLEIAAGGRATGINSAGWIVGTEYPFAYIPFLYDGTTTYRLSDLIPAGSGWNLANGSSNSHVSISDNNIIVGTGSHNNETRAFAMVPIPATPTPTPTGTPTPTPAPITTHFVVNVPSGTIQGSGFTIMVSARDQFNRIATGYTGTVSFTSTGGGPMPADSTLTNGAAIFTARLSVPGSQTITATDTSKPSITGTSRTIYVLEKQGPSPTPTPPPASQALQLSTRMLVQTGDNVGIGGFIIAGTAPKHVLLRAIGPSLAPFGVPNVLADPVMELHGPGGFATITNDNWRDTQIPCMELPPPDNLESAICGTLNPGAYTAIVRGKNSTSGVALVEVYDLSQASGKLANISTRAFVGTGSDVVIAGFILGGNSGFDRIVVRGIGPSLTSLGVLNALANPTLELRNQNGALLIANNNWQDNPVQASELMAAGLAPTHPLESGIAATLPPGAYTALLAGSNNGTGVGLVEVYDRGDLK